MPVLCRSLRSTAAAVAGCGILLFLAPAAPALAQPIQTRSWNFCFDSAIGSCSSFFLTTTAVFSSTGSRLGTEVAVRVRHLNVNRVVSGLSGFTFFGGVQDGVSDASSTRLTPEAVNGAPEIPTDEENRWLGFGRSNPQSRPDPTEHWYTFNGGFDPAQSQFIGGCLGGAFDASYRSTATTCGDQAYQMGFFSAVHLDANDIFELAVDVYAGDGTGDGVPDQASCRAPVDGSTGYGIDLGEPLFTATCQVSSASVPEPSAAALLLAALGLLAVGGQARRAGTGRCGLAGHRLWPAGGRLAMALVASTLVACAGAERAAAPTAESNTRTVVVDADVFAVIDDAEARVLPALDEATRAHLARPLADLRSALEVGDGRGADRALSVFASHIAADAPTDVQMATGESAAAAAADFSALTLLVDAVRQAFAEAPPR